jgi:hypothetical protein
MDGRAGKLNKAEIISGATEKGNASTKSEVFGANRLTGEEIMRYLSYLALFTGANVQNT